LTTNNRMELQAAIEGLSALTEQCRVELFTDSQYLRQGITQWIFNWQRNGWMTASRKSVKNEDQWRKLKTLTDYHDVHWNWVKGHAGHPENERADKLAVSGTLSFKVPK